MMPLLLAFSVLSFNLQQKLALFGVKTDLTPKHNLQISCHTLIPTTQYRCYITEKCAVRVDGKHAVRVRVLCICVYLQFSQRASLTHY